MPGLSSRPTNRRAGGLGAGSAEMARRWRRPPWPYRRCKTCVNGFCRPLTDAQFPARWQQSVFPLVVPGPGSRPVGPEPSRARPRFPKKAPRDVRTALSSTVRPRRISAVVRAGRHLSVDLSLDIAASILPCQSRLAIYSLPNAMACAPWDDHDLRTASGAGISGPTSLGCIFDAIRSTTFI